MRSVHLLSGETEAAASAVAGLVLSLVRGASPARPLVWATQPRTEADRGALYGPGLAALGCDPDAVLLVRTRSSRDVLWTLEQALASGAVSAAVGELPATCRQLNLTTTRRLALRSEARGIPVYLMTTGTDLPATACRSMWRLSPRPSRTGDAGRLLMDLPVWRAAAIKNKWGPCADLLLRHQPGAPPAAVGAGPASGDAQPVTLPPVARPSVEPAVVRLFSTRKPPSWQSR
jgi:protein ImuA